MDNKRIYRVLLPVIVASIYFFLRFYNLPNRINFDWDFEQDAITVRNMIVYKKPTLIGARVVGVNGFFLAPYHAYSLIPFYLLSQLDPLKAIISYVYVFNIILFSAAFFMLKKIFGLRKTLIFLILLSLNSLYITQQTSAWTPTPVILGLILIWFQAWAVYTKPSFFLFGLLGFTTGFFSHFHPQTLSQCLLFSILFFSQKNKEKIKFLLSYIFGFFLTFLPLVLFDLRHNFQNSRLIMQFILPSGEARREFFALFDFNNFYPLFRSFLPINFLPSVWTAILSGTVYLVFLAAAFFSWKTKTGFFKIYFGFCSLALALTPVVFSFYSNQLSEYYFSYLMPIFFLLIAEFASKINRYAILGAVALLAVSKINIFAHLLQTSNLGLHYKENLVQTIKNQIGGNQIQIGFNTPLGLNFGFNYLFDLYKINQIKNTKTKMYVINWPAKKGDLRFGNYGLFCPKKK